MKDSVEMSGAMADAMSLVGMGDFNKVESPERIAWLVYVLRGLTDRPEWFPRGKWATIQFLEAQLLECAEARAKALWAGVVE